MRKVLLVTGGSRGIGAATSILAAQKGWAVAVNYTSNSQAADDVVAQIKKADIKYDAAWFIKGKIDGLTKTSPSETILVEIKNRTKTLFKTLKDYEKPQIQCYMKLLGLKKAHLVEHIKEEDTNIITVDFENEYWNSVLDKLKRFITFFYDFLKDTQMQELVLINGSYDEEAENTIRKQLEDYLCI
jgi:hypothetical protein